MTATMQPYFTAPTRARQLASIARDWEGTPFHAHGRFKHVGVDCVWLAVGIYREMGIDVPAELPRYTVGAGSHLESSIVSSVVTQSGRFERIDPATMDLTAPGDLLGFKIGRVVHHVGIKLDGFLFVHARQGSGVVIEDVRGPMWADRLNDIWRPIDV